MIFSNLRRSEQFDISIPLIVLSYLIDFIIANDTNGNASENETLEPQATALINSFERAVVGENSASHDQVIERKFALKTRKEVNNAVTAVKKQVLGAILTEVDNGVTPNTESRNGCGIHH